MYLELYFLDRITTVSAWGVRCQQALGHPTVYILLTQKVKTV